ncbi:MAG: WYL domain-containing protein [Treponema sp.]|nr:WYL domain-containing protein [Treponema sp.]
MTIVFQWRVWYLYVYCCLRKGYRLFRVSWIRKQEILGKRFRQRSRSFEDFFHDNAPKEWGILWN